MKTERAQTNGPKQSQRHRGPSFDDLPDSALIRQAQLIPSILPFSAGTLWNMVRGQRFPAPMRVPGGRVTAWRVGDVRKFLQSLTA